MSAMVAILTEPGGEITTPHFVGLAEPSHPDGHLRRVCDLVNSAVSDGVEASKSGGLVARVDGRAYDGTRAQIGSAMSTSRTRSTSR